MSGRPTRRGCASTIVRQVHWYYYRAQTKGKIESGVRYVRRNFLCSLLGRERTHRQAREQQMSVEQRLALRRQQTFSWAEEIRRECVSLSGQVLPQSLLGQAVNYTLRQWSKLRRCFDYAEVELSNNLAENSMRPVALGRKNWLHVGSVQSGPKVAAILSIVESCRRIGVPLTEYLLDILPGMANRTATAAAALTPSRWLMTK